MTRGPRHAVLVEDVRRQAPDGPGVYLFQGDREEVLYVGKAINLRQRMLSHLRQDPRADLSRHSRLVFEIRGFAFHRAASELSALLLEDELIKRHRPRFNVRQNEFLEYKYLEVTADAYPRLRMVDHASDFGNRTVFGPYRDRYFLDDVLGLIHHHLGLRSCAASEPVDRCPEYDLEHCTGPCRDGISPREYRKVVARARAFLDGDVRVVASRVRRAMETASERLEFEKAQRLKERLDFCRRFGERQRFIAAFRRRTLIVEEEGEPELRYVFRRGRLLAHGLVAGAAGGDAGTTAGGDDLRFLLDRAALVHGWLRRNSGRCRYSFTDAGADRV